MNLSTGNIINLFMFYYLIMSSCATKLRFLQSRGNNELMILRVELWSLCRSTSTFLRVSVIIIWLIVHLSNSLLKPKANPKVEEQNFQKRNANDLCGKDVNLLAACRSVSLREKILTVFPVWTLCLFPELFKDALTEYSYDAELAGLHYKLDNTTYGLKVFLVRFIAYVKCKSDRMDHSIQ